MFYKKCLKFALCIFFPPAAVAQYSMCTIFITTLACYCGYLPGILIALFLNYDIKVSNYFKIKQTKKVFVRNNCYM